MSALKKTLLTLLILSVIFMFQEVVGQQKYDEEKSQNLKVLPKKISAEDLHTLMKGYAKSLGVKCNHCHVPRKDNPSKLNFASDEKPEKAIARKMIRMTADINKKYIAKIGENGFDQIACVTCHMGHLKPTVSVDSLIKE